MLREKLMIRINKKIEYALIALKFMAQKDQGELTSAREICDLYKTPFDTTAKVLQVMNNNGILHSVKGIKGGYYLARPLNEMTYGELSRVIHKKGMTDNFCQSSKGICDLYGTCNIIGPIESLNRRINHFLECLNLEDLLLNEDVCQAIHFDPLASNDEVEHS